MVHRFIARIMMAVALAALMLVSVRAGRQGVVLSASTAATPPKASNATEQFLETHNQVRAAVGVAPLRWKPNLGADASRLVLLQRDRKGCEFAELGASPYGANQAWSSYRASPAEVVGSWVGASKYYNRGNNTCAAGHDCGTYTQVVWRKTVELGCAQASCGKEGPTLTICLYYPHGNVQGETPY